MEMNLNVQKYYLYYLKNPSIDHYFSPQWFSSEQLKERAQLFCETINSPQPKTVWVGKRTNSISFI